MHILFIPNRLYFADTGYGAVQVVTYDGEGINSENREIIAIRYGKQFFDLAIFRVGSSAHSLFIHTTLYLYVESLISEETP